MSPEQRSCATVRLIHDIKDWSDDMIERRFRFEVVVIADAIRRAVTVEQKFSFWMPCSV